MLNLKYTTILPYLQLQHQQETRNKRQAKYKGYILSIDL